MKWFMKMLYMKNTWNFSFHKSLVLNPCVTIFQVPTPNTSLFGQPSVLKFLDFPQSHLLPSRPSLPARLRGGSGICPSRLSLTRCISELRWSLEECYGANQRRIIRTERWNHPHGARTLPEEMKSKKSFFLPKMPGFLIYSERTFWRFT